MLDYQSLFALAAVVREGSFERAARALNVTPSAISQRIRLLEERVGCALVVRGQPCAATEMGRRLCQHVDRVMLLEQELQEAVPVLAREGGVRVSLPIAVNADSLATWLAPVIAAFAADAPVLLEVAVDDQDYTAEWLRGGKVLGAAPVPPACGTAAAYAAVAAGVRDRRPGRHGVGTAPRNARRAPPGGRQPDRTGCRDGAGRAAVLALRPLGFLAP